MRRSTLFALALLLAACTDSGSQLALGTLERDRIALTATVAEVIVALPVAEGTQVTAGTVLVQLDDRQQRAALERAQAQVAEAEASLLQARNGPRAQDIAAARARVAGRTAKLREAQITYDRNHALIERTAVSQSDVDLYLALRDAAAAQLDEAKLAAAQAQSAYEQALLAKLTVTATRDGLLDNLPWNLGERVAVGSPLAILLAGQAPYARVYVPEPDRVTISKGTRLKVHVDGLDRVFEGTVRWISAFTQPGFCGQPGDKQTVRGTRLELAATYPFLPQSDHLGTLPFHHRDPFDRLLIAQALEEDLVLLSRDEILSEYGIRRLW